VKVESFLVAALVAALAGAACSQSTGKSTAAFGSGLATVAATPQIRKLEREMFIRLNRDRKELGLPPLQYDDRLADVARFHSKDMRDHRFFEHDSPTSGSLDDRLNAAGYLFLTARENLAEAPDVQRGQDSLLRSPGHYANIVATDTTHVGIGIVRGGVRAPENLTITQVFAAKGRAETVGAARAALIRRIQAARSDAGLPKAVQHPLLTELAERHLPELGREPSPDELATVGERITKEVAEAGDKALRGGVVVAAQLLPDSESFDPPRALSTRASARFGLAIVKAPDAKGRPMLKLLLLVSP
jgi:uncharacterized protein YkwD